MIAVEGFEDDALVARVERRHEGGMQRAGGPVGDEDVRVRVGVDAVEGLKLLRDRLAQRRDAVHANVDVVAIANRLDRGFDDRMRRIGVAHALRQVDAAHVGTGNGHGADLRLDEAGREFTEAKTGRVRRSMERT